MTWLQNSWMDNATFLAEMAHFAWAYGILLTAALWSATRRQLVCLFIAFVAFAVAKEYWYDLRYEIPADSVSGSTLDFCVYLLGGLVALAVVWLRRRSAAKEFARNVAANFIAAQANLNQLVNLRRDKSGVVIPQVTPRLAPLPYPEED